MLLLLIIFNTFIINENKKRRIEIETKNKREARAKETKKNNLNYLVNCIT